MTDTSESNSDETDTILAHIELHSMTDRDRKIIWVTPEIEGKKLKMDTGSELLLILLKDYKEKFAKVPQCY